MAIEFESAGLQFKREVELPAVYKGRLLGRYFVDFIVDDLVIVEIKSVEKNASNLRDADHQLHTTCWQACRLADQFQFTSCSQRHPAIHRVRNLRVFVPVEENLRVFVSSVASRRRFIVGEKLRVFVSSVASR